MELKYFVLKPKGLDIHAMASRAALKTYAMILQAEDPKMALEMRNWANNEMEIANAQREKSEGGYDNG